jgi:methionyl-tRNA formyltransferase
MKIIFGGRKKYSAELLEWTVSQGVAVRAVMTDSQFSDSSTALRAQEMDIPVIFLMKSMKKIDLEKDDINLKIRAFWFPPYDGAYINVKGTRYTLINDFILNQLAENGATFIKP